MFLPPSHALPSIVARCPFYDTLLPEFLHFIHASMRKKLLVIDVGANVGDTAALIAAKVADANCRFICIEADREYLPFLQVNTKNLDAEIVCAVMGAEPARRNIAIQHSGAGTSAIVASTETRTVVALDDLLEGLAPDLIKIDTDGYDIHVVRGGRRCLKNVGPHLFVEYSPHHIRKHGSEEPTRLFELASEAGYRATIVYDFIGYPICLIDLESRELPMIAAYIDARQDFCADFLFSKDRGLLERFYATDQKPFPSGRWTL